MAPDDDRKRLGALGEWLARRHLESRGYRVLAQNFRTRNGELDLVAADGATLVVCEVKTRIRRGRGDAFAPLLAVGAAKRRQLRRMATEYLSSGGERPRLPDLRFDAIGVTVDRRGRLLDLEHVEDAF